MTRDEIAEALDEAANYVGGLYNGLPQDVEQRFIQATIEARAALALPSSTPEAIVEAAKKALKALEPFALRVFNDNGDCTVTDQYLCGYDDFCNAYFAHKRLSAALSAALAPAPAQQSDPVPAQYEYLKDEPKTPADDGWNTRIVGTGPGGTIIKSN